ncbi:MULTISPECIES: hypothetical protein [Nostoc]|nr:MULTISPECIES: hypothetical protein [Nostoc]
MGHWALGIGHCALGIGYFFPCSPAPQPPSPPYLYHTFQGA